MNPRPAEPRKNATMRGMDDTKRTTHQALLGAWALIVVLLLFGPPWVGYGLWRPFPGAQAILCGLPILGHALVLRGRDAGGGLVALVSAVALVPAFLAVPFGYYVGVYPFFGLVWIAFLLANVVYGARALQD